MESEFKEAMEQLELVATSKEDVYFLKQVVSKVHGDLEEWAEDRDDTITGVIIAASFLVCGHGDTALAAELFKECGYTWEQVEATGLDAHDAKMLAPVKELMS